MDTPRRSIRIANCSGANSDPGVHMFHQAKHGQIDVITGDYLAEMNLAAFAESYAKGEHPGWVKTAEDGLRQTMPIANEKRIKIIINGGGLNPKGLAELVVNLAKQQELQLKVAYVEGDNLLHNAKHLLSGLKSRSLQHLDSLNSKVHLDPESNAFINNPEEMSIVSANAYLGYRAIKHGLDNGADIIICGRVADASPVIGAAAWWHGWSENDYDALAGSLIGGHLIECSTYVTGANFSGAYKYPVQQLLNLGLPIVEIASDGTCVVTKHEALGGFVTSDTVRCQLLYELQGNIYLNSDVKADITEVKVVQTGADRVTVSGIKGHPPPPTTKLAIFYHAGYQCEIVMNASGYSTEHKWDLVEAQIVSKLKEWGTLDKFTVLDFQRVGVPKENPDTQLSSTSYLRLFAQARNASTLGILSEAFMYNGMAHFAGMHGTQDFRTMAPKPFLGYFPAVIAQSELEEAVNIFDPECPSHQKRILVGPPTKTEPLRPRENYESPNPIELESFGPSTVRPLGDLVLGRSGDKGANINIGLFVHTDSEWDWLRSFMTRDRLRQLMGKDWKDWYALERVEMPHIFAVHYVIYGPLGRGVSSSRLLDALGKGFSEYIRAVHVPIPSKFL